MKDENYLTEHGRLNTQPKTVLYSLVQSPRAFKQNLKAGAVRFVDGGREKRCVRCKDWWPWDTEFFSSNQSHCRACEADRNRLNYEAK